MGAIFFLTGLAATISPAITTDCIFKIAELNTLGAVPDYTDAMPLVIQRTISVGETVDTDEVGPAATRQTRGGTELVFFGRLTYRELNGKSHNTGFALRVAPVMAAYVPYSNENYDYYD